MTRAGRPEADPMLKKIPVGYKLPRWLAEWLRDQGQSQAQIIEDAIVQAHNLESRKCGECGSFNNGDAYGCPNCHSESL